MDASTVTIVQYSALAVVVVVLFIWLILLQVQVVRLGRNIDLASTYGPPSLAIAGSTRRPNYSREWLRRDSKYSAFNDDDQNNMMEEML